MAIIGMFFQDGLTGSAWGDWANYTDSPLRAFENELGVQAPVGFWDPLGLSADGDVEVFRRRRETEIKHGRISMLATMGYITPELVGKFPGYLSPYYNLKFEDVPNGLAAISKVPFFGWFQIVLYALYCEASGLGFGYFDANADREPGNLGWKPPLLTTSDPELRKKKLQAELANGRLAMMAIIGMFFQDGLTGSAWGDWANYTASPLRAFESEFGVQAPVGFFDPVGFTKDGDEKAFKRRREVEIKHGRVSMLATMGYITPEVSGKFPGYLSPINNLKYEDIPNGLGALSKVPLGGWAQILAYCFFCELEGFDPKDREPGALGFKPPFLYTKDPKLRARRLNAELANGRLAMMAIIGMFFQDGLTGSAWGDWSNYTDSPLRAFENELGAQEPLGFWDPLGLSADGDLATFTRRRESEIKHGRISMLATMGYITPELTGKFPGYISPSAELQYADIPNGLGAISKVPALGWGQIVLYCAAVEAAGANRRGEAPGDFGWKVLTSDDPEQKRKKLAAELANGRLAMMAIIGMFFQDGLTGSAWGDWANYTDSPLRAFENELGVQAPFGFWDPLGLTKDGDMEAFKRRRATELKHGRVAMIACMGYITPEFFRWPGECSTSLHLKFEDIPNGLSALGKIPSAGICQWVIFVGLLEKGLFVHDPSRAPGDFENGGVLGVPNGSSMPKGEGRNRKLNAELANGRLAMMAIIGMFYQDGLTGSAWGDWSYYTDSPLRAFENELGVQSPVGFWDPLGLAADGNEERFRRRRETEIKHGRICMLATMGYMTPEITGKFSGYLSPSQDLKFEDVPNGLAAISKVPLAGWVQIFLYAGFCEVSAMRTRTEEPGNLGFKPPLLATDDELLRKRRLAAELANGRLAMFAIMGMFFQDGLTGSAWGDWSNYFDSSVL